MQLYRPTSPNMCIVLTAKSKRQDGLGMIFFYGGGDLLQNLGGGTLSSTTARNVEKKLLRLALGSILRICF